MNQTRTCPKCSGRMEEGFIPGVTHGAVGDIKWIKGRPERSFWAGLKVADEEQYPMTIYRCTACGFLEWYTLNASETLLRPAERASEADPARLLRPTTSSAEDEDDEP